MHPPFVILGLPRSRTFWLSGFLSYGEWSCGHDELRHCRSLDDVAAWLSQPCTGTVETAAAPFWRLLHQMRSDARIVLIRRPARDVVASLVNMNVGFDETAILPAIRRLDAKLDQIARRLPNVLSIRFDELAREDVCAFLFEHCLPYRHDPAWWAKLAPLNLQANMASMIRHAAAYRPQLDKLAMVAKHRMMAAISRQDVGDLDGLTFQQERFADFYPDAKALFAEHLVQTGQSPDDHARKNLTLLAGLDDLGALQITTARTRNGLMAGYLMSTIGPSLDSPGVIQAWHTIFFASPDYRRLGMKLQRAALAALRVRGVNEVLMRAGTRGSGPRLGVMYQRLGAADFGQLYRLELEP